MPGRSQDGPAIAVVTFNAIPRSNPTFKYERLGPMAVENQRHYCARHGYTFFDETPDTAGRPACWAKIPAVLRALENHRWVLWADSDALVFDVSLRLEDYCDPGRDLIVQCPREYFGRIGVDADAGLAAMPVNTGVFMMQSTAWSKHLLRQASEQEQFVSNAEPWNGIGDQEAIIAVLKQQPADLRRIRYVQGLQNHPALHREGNIFVHFYGNHAEHHIPLLQCEEVLHRWELAVRNGGPLPRDLARFHWCCIQNKAPDAAINRGGPERFLYRPQDIEA